MADEVSKRLLDRGDHTRNVLQFVPDLLQHLLPTTARMGIKTDDNF